MNKQESSLDDTGLLLRGGYDAIVVGGGITGWSAARHMSESGMKVGLIEPTGVLGREIVRSRSQFADLPSYTGASTGIRTFYDSLRERSGWYEGVVDPNAAAVAFDDVMQQRGVDIWFHVWPSRLITDGHSVAGLVVAAKDGYSRMEAARVVDASTGGKLARQWYTSMPVDGGFSLLNLIYQGVEGECRCSNERLTTPSMEGVRIACRPTYWRGEWRVSLMIGQSWTRADWLLRFPELLPALQQQLPELTSGVLAYVGDDVWSSPDTRVITASKDDTVLGYIWNEQGKPHAVRRRMLGESDVIDGLTLAGPWLDDFPVDRNSEEKYLVNGFQLGELAAANALL